MCSRRSGAPQYRSEPAGHRVATFHLGGNIVAAAALTPRRACPACPVVARLAGCIDVYRTLSHSVPAVPSQAITPNACHREGPGEAARTADDRQHVQR